MIVLDASAAIEWLLRTPKGIAIARRLFGNSDAQPGHVPHLLDVEKAHVMRRHVSAGIMSANRAYQAMEYLRGFPLVRYPHAPLLSRVWELRENLSTYDAVYITLAETLGAPVITCDGRIAGTPGHRARVELI